MFKRNNENKHVCVINLQIFTLVKMFMGLCFNIVSVVFVKLKDSKLLVRNLQ